MSILDVAIQQGTLASRPVSGIPWGSLYFTTDTGQAFYYNGPATTWEAIVLYPQTYTFSTLPTPVAGLQVIISDSTVNTWGTAITTGGGTDVVLAWYNGSQWSVLGV